MSRRHLQSAAVLILICVYAGPGTAHGRLSGAGASSCRVLESTAASRKPAGHAAVQWALGYITGRVVYDPNVKHRPFHGPDGIVRDLVAYCRHNRDAQVADAAEYFFACPPER